MTALEITIHVLARLHGSLASRLECTHTALRSRVSRRKLAGVLSIIVLADELLRVPLLLLGLVGVARCKQQVASTSNLLVRVDSFVAGKQSSRGRSRAHGLRSLSPLKAT